MAKVTKKKVLRSKSARSSVKLKAARAKKKAVKKGHTKPAVATKKSAKVVKPKKNVSQAKPIKSKSAKAKLKPAKSKLVKAKLAKAIPTKTKIAAKSNLAKKAVAPLRKSSASAQNTVHESILSVGSLAPDFDMRATLVGEVSLSSLKGKPFVLYFYPKDDTSGCTAEACGFRDALPDFANFSAPIVGVSKDNMESHEKFAAKYELSYPLASDEKGTVCAAYGAWKQKSMYGRIFMGIERSTFLIDGAGIIRAIWNKVSVPGHVDEVKKALASL